jgi:hypothetical protein
MGPNAPLAIGCQHSKCEPALQIDALQSVGIGPVGQKIVAFDKPGLWSVFPSSAPIPFPPLNVHTNSLPKDHVYRVNYDWASWQRIVRELDASTLPALSPRARAQLLGDFCYFNAVGN